MIRKEKNNKQVLITFDYELFLGKDSGTLQNCVIRPTYKILDIFGKYNAKGIFFVDASYLAFLKRQNHKDLPILEKQLHDILASGSNVELHFHPQWLNASMLTPERWTFETFDYFRLQDVPEPMGENFFRESYETLAEIVYKYNSSYRISAFRAGGWCIKPFDRFKKLLSSYDIYLDFSTITGIKSSPTSYAQYDYTHPSWNKDYWFFRDDPGVADDTGPFTEIPSVAINASQLNLWLSYYLIIKNSYSKLEGTSIPSKKIARNFEQKKVSKIKRLLSKKMMTLSLEGLAHFYYKKYFKKLHKSDKKILTVVGHPKFIAKDFIKNTIYLVNNYPTLSIQEFEEEFIKRQKR